MSNDSILTAASSSRGAVAQNSPVETKTPPPPTASTPPAQTSTNDDTPSTIRHQSGTADLRRRGNNVTFHEVRIYEFPVIIGDNPASPSGPPLSIGWRCYNQRSMDINLYEQTRKPKKTNLVVSETKRIKRLKGAGFTDNQIDRATELADKIRRSRRDNTPSAWNYFFASRRNNNNSFASWTGKTIKKLKNMELSARTT